MLKRTSQSKTSRQRRGGFTLVELLVSVTLVLMIMVMFASVYQMATDTVSKQKGIRRNDQRARMLSTVFRGDIANRTFVDVVPFVPGQDTELTAGPLYVPENRRGYFAISENDPNDQTDDVLAMTVIIPNDGSQLPYTGRATNLGGNFGTNANQPEFDDGDPNPNNTGASRAAEVIYFLRNGNLYRRVMLVRDSYADPANNQPPSISGPYANRFWEDFAFSAYYRAAPPPNNGPWFNGVDSLSNASTTTIDSITTYPNSLGVPHLRYGHTPTSTNGILPTEFLPSGTFIGRFTTQETASNNFLYPGRLHTNGDPHTRSDLTDTNNDGIVDQFNDNTSLRGANLLMTNVHEFDIKVWDDALGRFVDLGHGGGGRYGTNLRNAGNNRWNRYDTWHSFRRNPTDPGLGQRPFPVVPGAHNGPDGQPGVAGVDDDGNGTVDDASERGWLGTDDEIRLRAIQITIRFYDVSTDKMRQVTILQSLVK